MTDVPFGGKNMRLYISKLLTVILPVIGVLCIFGFTFAGNIFYGWVVFVVLALISGLINTIFFRCPHCGKSIPANSTVNQKYCPLCGEDLGMKPSRISYYGRCHKDKHGCLRGYTIVGPMVFIVCFIILLLIIIAIFGIGSLTKFMGRTAVIIAFAISAVLALFCRRVVSSAVTLDVEAIYYSKVPFVWKRYDIDDVRACEKMIKPFYHVNRGYVFATSKGLVSIPMAAYAGGQELFRTFTDRLGQNMPDVRPDLVISKHSEQAKADEEHYLEMLREYNELYVAK